VAEIDKMVTEVGEALVAEEMNPHLLSPEPVGERTSPQDTTR